MALIQIKDVTFSYSGSTVPVFQQVNLDLDTSWKLGLVGRNGRGKTTFLRMLMGELPYTGHIEAPVDFEYFPYFPSNTEGTALEVARQAIAPFAQWEEEMQTLAAGGSWDDMERYGEVEEAYSLAGGYDIREQIQAETGRLGIHPDVLFQPYTSLSGGEQVKLLLVSLFLKKHRFLLIDEPTDHLDAEGRRLVASWLAGKKGFIVVSHDRRFLDEAVTHILSINRADIELQRGNYSSWQHNRRLQDESELAQNKKLESDIARLKTAAAQAERWSDKIEKTKTKHDPNKKGPAMVDKGYIGSQAARMMQRSKSIERRRGRQLEEKQALLKNIETAEPVRFQTLEAEKNRLLAGEGLALSYGERHIFSGVDFLVAPGNRIAITGDNGSGKSSLLELVTGMQQPTSGSLWRMAGLVVSTVPQNTDFLQGSIYDFARQQGLDTSLMLAILRKLDFEREAFENEMQFYSAGQKKKVCLAASLAKPAHLFVWDEPLNYIDILSRSQIEKAVLACQPTLIFVEHDAEFVQAVATARVEL